MEADLEQLLTIVGIKDDTVNSKSIAKATLAASFPAMTDALLEKPGADMNIFKKVCTFPSKYVFATTLTVL